MGDRACVRDILIWRAIARNGVQCTSKESGTKDRGTPADRRLATVREPKTRVDRHDPTPKGRIQSRCLHQIVGIAP